jgi:prepilin-type N-terminal cleavage/methylation domain-containing protein
MQHGQPDGNVRDGFTLVELLAIIVVLGVLAAFLLPVYARARQQAQLSPCLSNLQRIGQAMKLYLDDHDGGLPVRMQSLTDASYIRDPQILRCPEDPTGNWGGIICEKGRNAGSSTISLARSPVTARKSVRYSYVHLFQNDWFSGEPGGLPQWKWKLLRQVEAGNPGVAVCQVHGRHNGGVGFPPNTIDYDGLVLQLRLDGSVVTKHIFWEVERKWLSGVKETTADPARLFSEAYSEAVLRALRGGKAPPK